MTALSAILGTHTALILAPVLLVQVLMALPAYWPRPLPQSRRFLAGILIPDNDEASVIATTLCSIISLVCRRELFLDEKGGRPLRTRTGYTENNDLRKLQVMNDRMGAIPSRTLTRTMYK